MNDYVGKIGNDMYYPKPTEPQAPPVKPSTVGSRNGMPPVTCPVMYEGYKVGDLVEIVSCTEGTTQGANVRIGDVYEVIEVDKYATVVKLASLLGDVQVDMEDINLANQGFYHPDPIADLATVIQAFDSVDIRKADDAQLRAYMNVAYDSYIYAESLINKRERMRTNK